LLRADLFGGGAARWARVPVIITTAYAVGDFRRARKRRSDRLLDAACSALPTHTIAVSDAVKRDCVERLGWRDEDVTVIRTGIDPPERDDAERAAELRQAWGVGADDTLVLTIARLSYEKGVDVLIDAAAILRESRTGVKVVVLGDGPDRAELEAKIQEQGLGEVVLLAGFHSDVWPALAAADIVCMPSKSEGMPNVLLEAMAASKPVVAAAVGGIPEAVVSDENGILVPPSDAPALAAALGRLMDDPETARRLSQAARGTVDERFLARDVVGRYAEVYRRLVMERKGQSAGVAKAN
jgi:glycosyltransferase involved in cell wall biosynthesis